MTTRRSRKPRPPLDKERLEELALTYVGRFATTRAKLAAYLSRKIRERGWASDREPAIDGIVARLASLGYVDDAAYALSKSRSLTGRGYGAHRVRQSLKAAGIEEEDGEPAQSLAESEALDSALRFARRRKLGPFAASRPDPQTRQKALAAMVRAGHPFELSRAIVSLEPGAEPDGELLRKFT